MDEIKALEIQQPDIKEWNILIPDSFYTTANLFDRGDMTRLIESTLEEAGLEHEIITKDGLGKATKKTWKATHQVYDLWKVTIEVIEDLSWPWALWRYNDGYKMRDETGYLEVYRYRMEFRYECWNGTDIDTAVHFLTGIKDYIEQFKPLSDIFCAVNNGRHVHTCEYHTYEEARRQ